MNEGTVQFHDGIVTGRTAPDGFPPDVRYDAIVTSGGVALRVQDMAPTGRPCDDKTRLVAAELKSWCRFQIGPDTVDGKAVVRIYVREKIPFNECK